MGDSNMEIGHGMVSAMALEHSETSEKEQRAQWTKKAGRQGQGEELEIALEVASAKGRSRDSVRKRSTFDQRFVMLMKWVLNEDRIAALWTRLKKGFHEWKHRNTEPCCATDWEPPKISIWWGEDERAKTASSRVLNEDAIPWKKNKMPFGHALN
ncbi:unnamed protein product [Caretta caretta]